MASGVIEAFNPNNPVAGVLGAEIGTPSASGDVPYNLVVDSTKQFVYAANLDIASVSGYRIGPGAPSPSSALHRSAPPAPTPWWHPMV